MKQDFFQTYNNDREAFAQYLTSLGYTLKSTNAEGNERWHAPDDKPGDTSLTIKFCGKKYNIHVLTAKAAPLEQGEDYSFSDARMLIDGINTKELRQLLKNQYGSDVRPGTRSAPTRRKEKAVADALPAPEPAAQERKFPFPAEITLDEDCLFFSQSRRRHELTQDGRVKCVYSGQVNDELVENVAYVYSGNDGLHSLVYRVKYAGGDKQLCQYRYDPSDGKFKIGGVSNKDKLLFNHEAVADAESVVVVEGEKCAHHLQRRLVDDSAAVVTSGGSNSSRALIFKQLERKTVYIIPDNDSPGRAYARKIKAMLPNAKVIRWNSGKPQGYDIADWLETSNDAEAVHDVNSLFAVLEQAGEADLTNGDYLKENSASIASGSDFGNKKDKRPTASKLPVYRPAETWKPFPLEALPPVTRDYVIKLSPAVKSDPAPVAMSLLAIAGGIVGARLKVRLGGAKWELPAIIWVAIVNISGFGKSPVLKPGMDLLSDKQRAFDKEWAERNKEYSKIVKRVEQHQKKVDKLLIQADEAEMNGDVENAESLRQQADAKQNFIDNMAMAPPVQREMFFSGAFSPQGLVDRASKNEFGFVIYQDELTQTFKSLADSSKIGAPGELLSFYDGASNRTALKDKERDRSATSCWAAMLGAIVPDNLRRYVLNDEKQNDGFLSRFFLIWSPPLPEIDVERQLNDADAISMKSILERLADFTPAKIPLPNGDSFTTSRLCDLSVEAKKRFQLKQLELHKQKLASQESNEISLLGKTEGFIGRLAVLLHVLEAAEYYLFSTPEKPIDLETYTEVTPISLDTYNRAEMLADWLVDETTAIYRLIGFMHEESDSDVITALLKDTPDGLTIQQIADRKRQFRDEQGKRRLEALMADGVANGSWKERTLKAANNKTTHVYYLD